MKKVNKKQRPNQKARETARRKERASKMPTTVKASQLARNSQVQKILADLRGKATSVDQLAELAGSISQRSKELMERLSKVGTSASADEPTVETETVVTEDTVTSTPAPINLSPRLGHNELKYIDDVFDGTVTTSETEENANG